MGQFSKPQFFGSGGLNREEKPASSKKFYPPLKNSFPSGSGTSGAKGAIRRSGLSEEAAKTLALALSSILREKNS